MTLAALPLVVAAATIAYALLTQLRESFPGLADFAEAFALCALRPRALGRLVVPGSLMKEDGRDHEIPLAGAFGALVARRLENQASSGLLFHDGEGGSLLGGDTKLGLSERAVAWRAVADFDFYTLRACAASRAELGGATDVQVSALLPHSRGINSVYSIASLVGAAMEAAARQAKVESRRCLVAVGPVDAEAAS